MISAILHKISTLLNDNIKLSFNLKQDLVKVQSVDSNATEGHIAISLANIERDTAAGISFNRKSLSTSHSSLGSPSWQINFYVLIAVVFPKKQYAESLKLITEMLRILQANHIISFDQSGAQYTLEPVNTSFQELSNLWSISGGTYYPSILFKVKTLQIDGDSILQLDTAVKEREINL